MLRILALIAALLFAGSAEAANRFWVGGTGTWDASDTTHWASTSGGAGGASVPVAGDTVTFDGSSGGGTVTVNHASLNIFSLTMSAFTGTLDFAANDNNITLTSTGNAFSSTGSGTRTLNMGDGTWTISAAYAIWSVNGSTNFTLNANGSTLLFSSTAPSGRQIDLITTGTGNVGTGTLNAVTLAAASSPGSTRFFINSGTATIGTLSVGAGNTIQIPISMTLAVTSAMTWTGTASLPIGILASTVQASATLSSANNLTCIYCAMSRITFSGGGAATATNSFDLGNNSGITITAPAAGGARVIGG